MNSAKKFSHVETPSGAFKLPHPMTQAEYLSWVEAHNKRMRENKVIYLKADSRAPGMLRAIKGDESKLSDLLRFLQMSPLLIEKAAIYRDDLRALAFHGSQRGFILFYRNQEVRP